MVGHLFIDREGKQRNEQALDHIEWQRAKKKIAVGIVDQRIDRAAGRENRFHRHNLAEEGQQQEFVGQHPRGGNADGADSAGEDCAALGVVAAVDDRSRNGEGGSDDEIGQQMGVSGDTVRNYISLTNLVPELMQMVDEKKIALSPAYQIAALKPEEQQMLVTTIDYEQATPSLSQAQRMKKFSQAGRLNEDSMLAIMSEEKKPEKFSLTFDGDRIRKYFPKSYTPLQMENTIIKLLEAWQKKRQRSQER